MSAKELRRIFGTSDLDKIAEERKEAQSLKKAKEAADAKADEERRAKLDEETRLKEDLKKKEDRIAELERLNSEKEEGMLADRQEQVLTKIAAKLFEEDYVDVALDRFRRHVRGLSSSKVRAMDEEDVSTWFRQYAEKHPKIARGADSTETDDDKKKRETAEAAKKPKVPLDTKPKDRKTATSSLDMGKFGGKTPRPGQPNSMNSTELAEYKRARGMSW
jgi:hypothetical protein